MPTFTVTYKDGTKQQFEADHYRLLRASGIYQFSGGGGMVAEVQVSEVKSVERSATNEDSHSGTA